MSGHGYSTYCPSCGQEDTVMAYSDHKPHDYVSGECLECGFSYYTKTEQLSLEEVNEAREQQDDEESYPPLTELAKGTFFEEN